MKSILLTAYDIVCCYVTSKNIVEPEFVHTFNIEELQQYRYYYAPDAALVSHERWTKYFNLH